MGPAEESKEDKLQPADTEVFITHYHRQTNGETDITTELHIASFAYIGGWRHKSIVPANLTDPENQHRNFSVTSKTQQYQSTWLRRQSAASMRCILMDVTVIHWGMLDSPEYFPRPKSYDGGTH